MAENTHQDENIEEVTSTIFETFNVERNHNGDLQRYDQFTERYYSSDFVDGTTSRNVLHGGIGATSSFINDIPIRTNGPEETNRHLQQTVPDVYWDPNPEIIHRPASEVPVRIEQRVFLKCLQPPALPPPEPIIIEERYREPLPLLPPLVIHEYALSAPAPPPLILRERPPVPPPRVHSETITRLLDPPPLPPRSLVIEKFPAQERLRDIIIERWIPYGPQPERKTIVRRAPSPKPYPRSTHTVIIHEKASVRAVQKFEYMGVTHENPADYVSRYGSSLLDPQTLIQQARNAGVTAKIECPCSVSSTTTDPRPQHCYCGVHGTSITHIPESTDT